MGRQICFFITNEDLKELEKHIKSKGGSFVNKKNEEVQSVENGQGYIVFPDSKLFYWENYQIHSFKKDKIIDQSASDIIVFTNCSLSQNCKVINGYEHGRFWYDTSYYDNEGRIVKKNKKLTEFFNALKRYITKNYKISEDKWWYIGPDAYKEYLKGSFVPCSGTTLIKF